MKNCMKILVVLVIASSGIAGTVNDIWQQYPGYGWRDATWINTNGPYLSIDLSPNGFLGLSRDGGGFDLVDGSWNVYANITNVPELIDITSYGTNHTVWYGIGSDSKVYQVYNNAGPWAWQQASWVSNTSTYLSIDMSANGFMGLSRADGGFELRDSSWNTYTWDNGSGTNPAIIDITSSGTNHVNWYGIGQDNKIYKSSAGAWSQASSISTAANYLSVDATADGSWLGLSRLDGGFDIYNLTNSTLYTWDNGSGSNPAIVDITSFGSDHTTWYGVSVPEPATVAILGLGALLFSRKRK